MTLLSMTALLWSGALTAGLVGALTGLGGGVVIVPMLALGFGVDVRYAIGASLLSVIATSSGAAAAYVKEGITNIRVGMFLEVATTMGAIAGALVATHVSTSAVAILFGAVLLGSVATSFREPPGKSGDGGEDRLAGWLGLEGSYRTALEEVHYRARRVPLGFGVMVLAGALSGLLGIGSGALKVIAMDNVMRLPFKVSTATSNFMIGVTAAASAGIYVTRGYIDPALAFPVVLGALPGALVGSRLLPRIHSNVLRLLFAGVIGILAVEMLYKGITGRL
ncbi:MAG TPA: sulfite exporter TauE/SafE family protein [Anaeromyxobacteraceae bacterium]|nr:sulfite exporter TauE/SafE family protein [Anaeromyxobacteraceae bacterium]